MSEAIIQMIWMLVTGATAVVCAAVFLAMGIAGIWFTCKLKFWMEREYAGMKAEANKETPEFVHAKGWGER